MRGFIGVVVVGLMVAAGSADGAQPEVGRVTLLVGSRFEREGGPAKPEASPLKNPFGIDFDRDGTMFLVELEGGRVHEWKPGGEVTVISGATENGYRGDGGPVREAIYNGMHNLAITKSGRMFISDTWNHCVREIDLASRTISTYAGTGKAGYSGDGGPAREAQFNYVMCVTLTPDEGTLLIADLNNRRIRAIDLKTNEVRTVAGNGKKGVPEDGAKAVESPLVDPRAVAADSKGRVYVLERGGHALRVVETDGTIRTVAGTGKQGYRDGPALEALLGAPKHLCVDAEDRVFIADDANGAIRCYDPKTETVGTVLGRGHGDEKLTLNRPHGVCVEKGRLYVADTYHHRLFVVDFVE